MSTGTYTFLHVLVSLAGIGTGLVVMFGIPGLKALAPTQKEPPFLVAQLLVLLIFATLTVLATVRFHPERVPAA